MKPSLIVFSAWLVFGASHLALSGSPVRKVLVSIFGTRGFTLFFSAVTAICSLGLILSVLKFGDAGYPAPRVATHPLVYWVLCSICAAGAVLAVAGLMNYQRSPIAILARKQRESGEGLDVTLPPPTALEQISRHPFFVGLCIMMTAHALLATTLASLTYFVGFAVFFRSGDTAAGSKATNAMEKELFYV